MYTISVLLPLCFATATIIPVDTCIWFDDDDKDDVDDDDNDNDSDDNDNDDL
jgi:hypothetical protein